MLEFERINNILLAGMSVANNALIIVREVNEGLDMTLENNRTFRNIDFFRKLK